MENCENLKGMSGGWAIGAFAIDPDLPSADYLNQLSDNRTKSERVPDQISGNMFVAKVCAIAPVSGEG